MGLADQIKTFQQPLEQYGPDGTTRLEPTAAELLDGDAAPGRDPDYPVALLYMADHETLDDGLCRQARTHAAALAAAGCPLRLQTISNRVRHGDYWHQPAGDDFLDPTVLAQVQPLRRKTIGRAGIVLHHIVLSSAGVLEYLLVPHHMRGYPEAVDSLLSRTIVYSPYEADRLPKGVSELLSRCGQVWVQCNANLRAFLRSGVPESKVWVVPNAYDPPTEPAPLPPVPQGKVFYHIGKWEPRKNQHQMIGAFMHAYGPTDPALLFLKTSGFGQWESYPGDAGSSIAAWLMNPTVQAKGWTTANVPKRIIVHTRQFTDREIARLHGACNIYVTMSHAEGWDYPAFDALVAGNNLIHVGNGGSEDYAQKEWAWSVPYEIKPVDPGYIERLGWHPDARWAEPGFPDMVKAFREAAPPAERVHRLELDRYRASNIGKLMLGLVEQLARERSPKLYEVLP